VHVAKLLLERDADANAAAGGFAALHWAAGSWETTLTATDITIAREGNWEWNALAGMPSGRLDLVKALLAHGADPNLRMKATPQRAGASRNNLPELVGATAYVLAAMAGEPEVMRALVDAGADVSLTTESRSTALMAAAGFGRILGENSRSEPRLLQAARLALELGGGVATTDAFGNTALHYAAYHRLSTVVQFLVDNKAPLEAKNKFGETPLWLSQLAIQFFGGGTYQVLRSPTSDLLRKLGAVETTPSYDRTRPRDWPDNAL
jgi:ankyrin repeat protein